MIFEEEQNLPHKNIVSIQKQIKHRNRLKWRNKHLFYSEPLLHRHNSLIYFDTIVQYFENEDPSNPGNWNLVWSFDENDIPDGANRINFKDPASHPYFRAIAGDKYGIRFKDPSAIVTLHTYFFEQLRKWLDENADANKEVSIELETIFVARVAVENGEKVFALEPAGEMKVLIKDDAAIEK